MDVSLCCGNISSYAREQRNDSAIRAYYRKYRGDGKDYFLFLSETKNLWKELETTIRGLLQKYLKRETKIIDHFNWMKAR